MTLLSILVHRNPKTLYPHEFIDHLTMDHNNCFRPKQAKIYDTLFMQALLFSQGKVLLMKQKTKKLENAKWEIPQSTWHAYDLSDFPEKHAQVERHALTALNRITDLLPEQVCPYVQDRHDYAVDIVKSDGAVRFAWAIALSYEMRMDVAQTPSLRCQDQDVQVGAFDYKEILELDMEAVWKVQLVRILRERWEMEKMVKECTGSINWDL
jgi:hypothetical protein